ncbi:MAG: hypothetical protein Q7R34_02460, partial [Dehalococcoidia bacterium]|nr:hypothetical protein [Dehalococcoidia bacterium]
GGNVSQMRKRVPEMYVYYDPAYDPDCTEKFIGRDVSCQIVDFLKRRDFHQIDAAQLKQVMLDATGERVRDPVVVFAQDVAPDTVLDDHSAAALASQYLDVGGSIVWVGDIPFWYQAKQAGKKRDDEWWRKGAAVNVLGVNPVFPFAPAPAEITELGRECGISVEWTGIRPVILNEDIRALVKSRCWEGYPHHGVQMNRWSRFWEFVKDFEVAAGAVKVKMEFGGKLESREGVRGPFVFYNHVFANAWFKNFNRKKPKTGFTRLWDYAPRLLSEKQLENLYRVSVWSTLNP